MSHPLIFLLALQGKALGRRLTRGLRTVKGAFLIIFGVAMIVLWLLPSVMSGNGQPPANPETIRTVAPVALLGICLMNVIASGGERAITFSPAEVDFLFPAPFTRRQLLAFKIGKSLAGITFSSLLMSAAFLRHAGGWGQAVLAAFLTLIFMQLFSMAVALLAQSAGERAYTWGRKIVLGVVALAIAIPILPSLLRGGQGGIVEVAATLRQSAIGSVVLAPLEAFGRLFTATKWFPEVAMYAGIALAINAALLWIVLRLDADYLEASAAKSTALHERIQRLKQGGLMGAGKVTARGSLPLLPYWRGAGPIIWRQMTSVLRSSRGMLLMLAIGAIAAGPLLMSASQENPTSKTIGLLAWITIMAVGWLRFDFRGDLQRMDHLKSLPTARWAVAAGQIATPTLILSLVHILILAGVMIATKQAPVGLVMAVALSLPFNALLVGIENVLFLYYPVRVAVGAGDFQGFGRQMLTLMAKLILMLIAGGLAALAGLLAHTLTDSWLAAGVAAGVVLSIIAATVVLWAGAAFGRFDVAGDLPE